MSKDAKRVGHERFRSAPAARRSRAEGVVETLHSLERHGRPALLVLMGRDREGHVLEATACDPEDYE